jgi:hypothetical protein
MRCTLRISHQGIFVDDVPKSSADAVAYCKRTAGAMAVSEEYPTTGGWDETPDANVVIGDEVTKREWDEMRLALRREGVRIYVRGPLCYDPRPDGCRPKAPAKPGTQLEERRVAPRVIPEGVLVTPTPEPKPEPTP